VTDNAILMSTAAGLSVESSRNEA